MVYKKGNNMRENRYQRYQSDENNRKNGTKNS